MRLTNLKSLKSENSDLVLCYFHLKKLLMMQQVCVTRDLGVMYF